jgi:hypothetical protein
MLISLQLTQQQTAQTELEDQQHQIVELLSAKKQLQADISDLKGQLEMELLAHNEESSMPANCFSETSLTLLRCALQTSSPSAGAQNILNIDNDHAI